MSGLSRKIQQWMLPGAIVFGISLYCFYHFTTLLHPWGATLHRLASDGQRIVIAILLFFQFTKVSPRDIHLTRWHLFALLFQVGSFLAVAALDNVVPPGNGRILVECAMLCLICPTAAAAGVVTEKLGGKLNETVSYLVLANLAATFLIPIVIPMVRPSAEMGFWAYVGHIAWKIFPLLVLPCLLAWLVRYTAPRFHRFLVRISPASFYVWGVGLTLAMVLSMRALLLSHLGGGAILLIVVVSLLACALQFFLGRRFKADPITRITAAQAMGQKNTGFLIWLGYNYMTPVTSVSGGLYAIWQNLFNSWELRQKLNKK